MVKHGWSCSFKNQICSLWNDDKENPYWVQHLFIELVISGILDPKVLEFEELGCTILEFFEDFKDKFYMETLNCFLKITILEYFHF